MRRLELPDDQIKHLYEIGVPVSLIAEELGCKDHQIKRVVRNNSFKRDESNYSQGVAYLCRPGEVFRPSLHYGYWVSNQGRVISMRGKPGTVMRHEIDKDGYSRVGFFLDGKTIHYPVHRLVLFAFVGSPGDDQVAAHNNGIRDDNRLVNLRWASQSENMADKLIHGTSQVGSRHGMSTTNEARVLIVKKLLSSGATIKEASNYSGVGFSVVADISRGRTWRHVN